MIKSKLKVVYVSAEVSPYAKSGEMADVASSLPKYLSYLGMNFSVFMPKYRRPEIESLPMELVCPNLTVPLGEGKARGRVYRSELGKHDIYFIDSPKYFWREAIYGTGKGEYLDNDERFIFFSRAVLEYLLKDRYDSFSSVRNGVDYETWDPANDPYIACNYTAANLSNKMECKSDLIKEFGLSVETATPLIGVVSHITANKGFDILLESMDELIGLDVGLVVLGEGDEAYEKRLSDIQKKYPGKIAIKLEFNPCLTHKIAAGVDIFLIPSRYEPCGLNQLISFRYGSVPVVRATGGLRETVKAVSADAQTGNGFLFKEYSSRALLGALKEAVCSFRKTCLWKRIMLNGLEEDYSWENAAKRYARLYQSSLNIKRGG